MTGPARPEILRLVEAAGHVVFDGGRDYNLNLVVERRSYRAGVADDVLHLCYPLGGVWAWHQWPCTSVPHPRYLLDPLNPAGTAVLCPGQHRGSHRPGWHPGEEARPRRRALVATRALPVWRDRDLDDEVDVGGPVLEARGINVHDGMFVAGCIGLPSPGHMVEVLALVQPGVDRFGERITLTVVDNLG